MSLLPNRPDGTQRTPRIVAESAAGRKADAVWVNGVGGLTFQLGEDDTREFVKWNPRGNGVDLGEEIRRLEWARQFIIAPRVIKQGEDDEGSWFVSAGLPGRSAVDDRWRQEPATAVREIGRALRAIHDALPVDDCPFDWSAESRVASAEQAAADGKLDQQDLHDDLQHLTVERALELIADIPPVDKLVVCHGDSCSPNTLIGDDGHWTAHVDLGSLGVADRWADLAVATWSTEWNYGPGWTAPLLEAYGIAPDRDRITYYKVLWDLG